MYANATLPLTLLSKKLNVPFSSRYFNGIKIVTTFKCIFEATVPKLLVNFGNHNSQDSQRTNIPAPFEISVLLKYNTETNVHQIWRWSATSFSLVYTQRKYYCITCTVIQFMPFWVCLEPVTTCWYDSIIKWHHHCTSVVNALYPRWLS